MYIYQSLLRGTCNLQPHYNQNATRLYIRVLILVLALEKLDLSTDGV